MTPAEARALAPPGWTFVEYDRETGLYAYQTGSYATGFKVMECLEEDLTPENLALMVRLGVTRTPRKRK